MKCGFDYCIYNEKSVCLLDRIEIDSLGQCEDCIIVSLPEYKLAEYKSIHLRRTLAPEQGEEC